MPRITLRQIRAYWSGGRSSWRNFQEAETAFLQTGFGPSVPQEVKEGCLAWAKAPTGSVEAALAWKKVHQFLLPYPETPTMALSIKQVLIDRDGMAPGEAQELIDEARERVANGENPEEILHDDFGLEPDYFFDLLP